MLAAASLAPFFVQLSLDLSTPLEVVEMLRSTVDAHVRANPNEFTGSSAGAALLRATNYQRCTVCAWHV